MSRGAGTARVHVALVAMVLAASVALAGCVAIPRSGPVIRADQTTTRASSQVEIAPRAPSVNASARSVVEGFLQAMAAYEPDYATARLYLAPDVRASWRPHSGVTVYADGHAPEESDGKVVLEAPVTGRADARGAYTPVTEEISTDFGLEQDAEGQWRITSPPEGLLVSQFVFGSFFRHVDLYWPDPGGGHLVPDPVSLAQGRMTPTTLVEALTAGPGEWIAPAVRTSLPGGSGLNAPVEVDGAGVATVDLSGPIDLLDQKQRRLLAGQLTWTLGQVPSVRGVRVLHDGSDFPLGDVAGQDAVVEIQDTQALSPVPPGLDNHLFAITDGVVVRVDQSEQSATFTPIPGPFGDGGAGPVSLAITAAGDTASIVSGGGSRVSGVDLATGTSTYEFSGFTRLLRPQYARTGELWLVSGAPGSHRVQVVVDGSLLDVDIGALVGERISAFRLSPDGVRLALVVDRDGSPGLAMARIDRDERGFRVDGLRPVPLFTTSQTELTTTWDVGWAGPGELVALAGTAEADQPSPYRLDPNAITVRQIGQADRWRATTIATLPDPETTRMVILGDQSTAWRYEEDFTWPEVSRKLTAAAYPG